MSNLELSNYTYNYDGTIKTPKVVVKNLAGTVLKENEDYNVVYPGGRIRAGSYTISVTGVGNYYGSLSKSFKILETPDPELCKHQYGAWRTIKTATCTSDGQRERTCSFCGHKVTESIDAIGHSWSEYILQQPTEFETGVMKHSCGRCGETYNTEIAAIVLPTDLPNVSISKPAAAKKKITVKWKKPSKKNLKKIQGIEIRVTGPDYDKIFTAGKKKTSKKIGGLTSKKKYKVSVRAYRYIDGVKHVSKWSGAKTVKTK